MTFSRGFLKCAYSLSDANKVLGVAKKLQLPKASGRIMPNLSGGPALGQLVKETSNVFSKVPEMGKIVNKADAIKTMQEGPLPGLFKQGPRILPGAGSVPRQMQQAVAGAGLPALPQVPAQQQKFLHSIVKGHELDEATVPGRMGAQQFGHRSPDVIYREHNRVVTAPKGTEETQNLMRAARSSREGAALFPKGMEYGQGQRLSRHARRRLTDMHEARAIAELQDAIKKHTGQS